MLIQDTDKDAIQDKDAIFIDDTLIQDELGIEFRDVYKNYERVIAKFITKDEAISIILHLQKLFNL